MTTSNTATATAENAPASEYDGPSGYGTGSESKFGATSTGGSGGGGSSTWTARRVVSLVASIVLFACGLVRLYLAFQPSANKTGGTYDIEFVHVGDCLDSDRHVVSCSDPAASQKVVKIFSGITHPAPFSSPTTAFGSPSLSTPGFPGPSSADTCPFGSSRTILGVNSACVEPA